MGCLFVLVSILGLLLSPLGAGAQTGETGTTSEPNLQKSQSWSEPAPEEPVLLLELDPAGVKVAPSPLQTVDGYTLEAMDLRVRRARIGLLSMTGATVVGAVLLGTSIICVNGPTAETPCWGQFYSGVALTFVGAVGINTTGAMLGVRKGKRRRLREVDYGKPRRVQWDLSQSRLVL